MNTYKTMVALAILMTASGCGPKSDVGANISEMHDNAADAIDNRADMLDNQADLLRKKADNTRDWGKDLKKEADRIAKDGGHPDQATLNGM